MSELEPLAKALQQELGAPPEAWLSTQRSRLRRVLRSPPRPRTRLVIVPAMAAALGVLGVLVWLLLPARPTNQIESWLVAEELSGPLRLADGSTISLDPGGRGRLSAAEAAVRFDLHRGRASFDVTPNQGRQWTITAGKNEVRVLGTRFSVFYGAAEAFEVQVERGTVAVQVADRSSSIRLEAGDRLEGQPGRLALTHDRKPASIAPTSDHPTPAEPSVPEATASASSAPVASQSVTKDDWQTRYREGKYAESLTLARKSGIDARLNELPPSTLAELADVARLGGDPELAVRALTLLLQRFPGSPQARDGKFLLGRVQALRGDTVAAIRLFESYLESNGSALYASEAIGRLMELHSNRRDTARARAMATRYLGRAPNGPYQRLARSILAQKD